MMEVDNTKLLFMEPRFRRILKIALLWLVIGIVWGLLTLPIVFYNVTTDSDSEEIDSTGSDDTNCSVLVQSNATCLPNTTYEGEVCREYLEGFQSCLPERSGSSDIYIAPQDDQDVLEMMLATLFGSGLQFLGATPECESAIRPFLCLSSFPLCDGDRGVYTPSCGQCVSIRDATCATVWAGATVLLQSIPGVPGLPVCELLPDPSGTCIGSGLSPTNDGFNGSSGDTNLQTLPARNCSTVQCSEGFYCTVDATSNVSVCRPRCDTWEQYPDATQAALDALVIIGGVVGLIAGTVSLIITAIRWRKLLTFPSVFSVYLNISVMVYDLLNLVSFVDKPELYCRSIDLEDSVDDPTFFCSLSGVLLHYLILQTAYWWFIHVAALFYIIKFPFQAKVFLKSKMPKFVHFAMVLVALILPAITVIVITTTDGVTLASFPPQLCVGRNPDVVFYSFLLPLILLSQVGITLLLLLFYIIHQHHGLFRPQQSKSPIKISTAEKKILISFCSYFIVSVIGVITYTLLTRDADNFERETSIYFMCEALGVDPNNPCDRDAYLEFTNPAFIAISSILFLSYPLYNLIYVIDFRELKQFYSRFSSFSPSTSTARPEI